MVVGEDARNWVGKGHQWAYGRQGVEKEGRTLKEPGLPR